MRDTWYSSVYQSRMPVRRQRRSTNSTTTFITRAMFREILEAQGAQGMHLTPRARRALRAVAERFVLRTLARRWARVQ